MNKLVWLTVAFLGLVCVALWRGAVFAQDQLWETCMRAGARSQQHGRAAEAARLYQVASKRAERFGPGDARLVTSLASLADLYRAQGDYQKAEPLYQRALAIGERTLGPDHPTVLACRNNYAALLRATGREAEAVKLDGRAPATQAEASHKRPAE